MKKRATIFKMLTAGFFLAVFLFIHVVKIVHHHHESTFAQLEISQTGTSLLKAPDCSVCDYHFVKDAQNNITEFIPEVLTILLPSYTNYLAEQLTSIGLSAADRGPPAVA